MEKAKREEEEKKLKELSEKKEEKQESQITVETSLPSAFKEVSKVPSTYILLVLLAWVYYVGILWNDSQYKSEFKTVFEHFKHSRSWRTCHCIRQLSTMFLTFKRPLLLLLVYWYLFLLNELAKILDFFYFLNQIFGNYHLDLQLQQLADRKESQKSRKLLLALYWTLKPTYLV